MVAECLGCTSDDAENNALRPLFTGLVPVFGPSSYTIWIALILATL